MIDNPQPGGHAWTVTLAWWRGLSDEQRDAFRRADGQPVTMLGEISLSEEGVREEDLSIHTDTMVLPYPAEVLDAALDIEKEDDT